MHHNFACCTCCNAIQQLQSFVIHFTACPIGRFKPNAGNDACTECPSLFTTVSTGAATNCSVCRYTEGPYPYNDTCYCKEGVGEVGGERGRGEREEG